MGYFWMFYTEVVIFIPTFNNIKDLIKYVESNVVVSLEQIGKEIKSVLRHELLTTWYETYTPQYYERTNMLIESISVSKAKKVGNSYEVKIFFDETKILPVESDKGMFPAHMNITDGSNIYNGMSYGELLPLWVEKGQHSSIHSYTGVKMTERTVDWIKEDNYLKVRMLEILKDKGFICI